MRIFRLPPPIYIAVSLFATVAIAPARADGNVIDAQHVGSCVWDGVQDVSSCIQAAINSAAQRGGTVHLPHGTWPLSRPLIITSNLTIEGDDRGTTLKPREDDSSKPLLLRASKVSNVRVEKTVFDGGGQDFSNPNPVITVTTATNVVFDGVTVQNARGLGLLLQGGIKSSTVRNSHFVNIGNHWKTTLQRTDRSQALVFCCGTGNGNNFATGNRFEEIGLDALQISDQNGFIARDNVFDLEGDQFNLVKSPDYPAAIFPMQSANVEIARNIIRNAPGNGIDAPGLQNSTIANNVITGCGGTGIGLFLGYDKKTQTAHVSIVGNKVINNARWKYSAFTGGITISYGSPKDIAISGNTVSDMQNNKTQGYGVQIGDHTNVSSLQIDHSNRLSGNRVAELAGANYTDR